MEQTPAFHPLDYLSMVRRRVWWLVVPIVLAVLIGTALAIYLPREYLSTATLGISLPGMGGQVVSEAQRLTPQERTRSINQVLLSRPVLERVAQETGLAETMPLDAAVQHLAGNVNVRLPMTDPASAASMEIFYVDYQSAEPAVAQQVANRLAEVFVEESSLKREVRYENTSKFIAEALEESEKQLEEIQARLTDAKESFMGSLPEQTSANVAMVTNLGQELNSTSIALRSEQDRLSMIEERLQSYRPATPRDGEPAAPASLPPDQQVLALQQQLAKLLTDYTEQHAAVRQVQRELDLAKARAAARPATPAAPSRAPTTAIDPDYQRLLDAELQSQQRVQELQRKIETIQQDLADYRARVDSAPRVQQQIAGLERQYELEKANVAKLTSQLQDAQMAESVERIQGGEQFTIIAAAPLPSSPSTPNVPRLMTITVLLGICFGGALAFGREYLDRSIHDARNLNDLDVPVLGEIPRIYPGLEGAIER